jgi:DNA-binding NarL/FixJ family response regulator
MSIRVAIFEDNKLVRESFEAILNGTEGFVCTGSFSSCNNLGHDLRKSRPDIILMDIEMPGRNGIDATRIITEQYASVKILIQTVFEDDDKIFDAICAGASGYILKKSSPAKLIDAILEVYNGGSPMSPGIATKALQLLRRLAPATKNKTPVESEPLTQREKEILSLMMDGYNFHAIAQKSFISYDTVRTHVRHIYRKIHVSSVNEAIAKAFRDRMG